MNEKTDEQILYEIEVHNSNAVRLLKRVHEIRMSALDLDNLDAYIAVMKQAMAFQKISIEEMGRAVNLQNILAERRLSSFACQDSKLDVL